MKNFEKYESEIEEIANNDEHFAVNNLNNNVTECDSIACENCLLNGDCGERAKLRWLCSEYKEPVKITKVAKTILENINPVYKWIAKDATGYVFVYEEKPRKCRNDWDGLKYASITNLFGEEMFNFLNWNDKEPTNIKELLNVCKVIGNG